MLIYVDNIIITGHVQTSIFCLFKSLILSVP